MAEFDKRINFVADMMDIFGDISTVYVELAASNALAPEFIDIAKSAVRHLGCLIARELEDVLHGTG